MNSHELIGAPRVDRDVAPSVTPSLDPLRYCVMTTVALLAWALGPAVVLVMSGIGFVAYWHARRGGLEKTRCVLKYPVLVLTYLGAICLAAGVALVR